MADTANQNESTSNEPARMELKKFGEILQLMLLSSMEDFTYAQIVQELRDEHGINIEDVLQQFGCEPFELLLETETQKKFVEYEYSLEAGEFLFRGKETAGTSAIRKEMFESKNVNLTKQLEKERNERINLAREFDEFKKEVETLFDEKYNTNAPNASETQNADFICPKIKETFLAMQTEERNQQKWYELIDFESLSWFANRWSANDSFQGLKLSANGLNIKRMPNSSENGFIRTIHGIEFPPPRRIGIPQICYFEIKLIEGEFAIGFCGSDLMPGCYFRRELSENQQIRYRIYGKGMNHACTPMDFFGLHTLTSEYFGGALKLDLPRTQTQELSFPYSRTSSFNVFIPSNKSAVVGCGVLKHLGQRRIFFTGNGQLLEMPIHLPSTAPNELFPFMILHEGQFEETNFGQRPFQFKFENNEEKLQEMIM